ncbi:hypothetical protein ACXX9E_29830 [Pseudomonas sp. GNP014]
MSLFVPQAWPIRWDLLAGGQPLGGVASGGQGHHLVPTLVLEGVAQARR